MTSRASWMRVNWPAQRELYWSANCAIKNQRSRRCALWIARVERCTGLCWPKTKTWTTSFENCFITWAHHKALNVLSRAISALSGAICSMSRSTAGQRGFRSCRCRVVSFRNLLLPRRHTRAQKPAMQQGANISGRRGSNKQGVTNRVNSCSVFFVTVCNNDNDNA